ncbi:MAG TPA: hypothetical protein VGE74_18700 [Gemmata sp.]
MLISAATIERRIQRLAAAGRLPPGHECVGCGSRRAAALDVRIACETAENRVTGGFRFLIIPGLFWMIWREEERLEILGRDNTVRAPINSCSRCAEEFIEPRPSSLDYLLAAVAIVAFVVLAALSATAVAAFGPIALVVMAVCLFAIPGVLLVVMWRARAAAARWQWGCKEVLSGVPVYKQLLREYPHAVVLLARRMWIDGRPR